MRPVRRLLLLLLLVSLCACDGTISVTQGPGQPALILGANGNVLGTVTDPDGGDPNAPPEESPPGSSSSAPVSPPPEPATSYPDVPSDAWYAGAVTWCRDHGLLTDLEGSTFAPDVSISRSLLVQILYRASGSPRGPFTSSFPDLPPTARYRDAVAWAVDQGLISGRPDGSFHPGEAVTRAEAVTLLWRSAGTPLPDASVTGFPDDAAIPDWARSAVCWATQNGLLSIAEGVPFLPDGYVSRAQWAVLLERFLNGGSQSQQGETVTTRPFPDVPSDAWYADALVWCRDHNLLSGLPDGTFAPDQPMTRAMTVVLLSRIAQVSPVPGLSFPDVEPDAWYRSALSWAITKGLVSGGSDGLFHPDSPITRQDAITLLWRSAGSPDPGSTGSGFADDPDIAPYARPAVCWAARRGLISGASGARFDPAGFFNRSQAAALLQRYLNGASAAPDGEEPSALPAPGPFPDVSADAWYADAVTWCRDHGILAGLPDGTFAPDQPMTLATFLTALYRLSGSPTPESAPAFPDLPAEAWYTRAVTWAASRQLVSGDSRGLLHPEDPLSRQSALTILWRLAGTPTPDGSAVDRPEDTTVPGSIRTVVRWARQSGLLQGGTDGAVYLEASLTRAQGALLLERSLTGQP